MNNKNLNALFIIVSVIIGAVIVYGIGNYVQNKLEEQKATNDKQAAKELFVDLATNPEKLFEYTVGSDKKDPVFNKMAYKDSQKFRQTIDQSRKVINDQDTVTVLNKAKASDKKAQSQQSKLFKVIGSDEVSDEVKKDLGITDSKSSRRWKWFFSSKDLVFSSQKNTAQVQKYLAKTVRSICLNKQKETKRDCRIHDDTKRTVAGNVNFTIKPIKVSNKPLTYRLFILDRSYVDTSTSNDAATQRALELEMNAGN